MRAIDAARHIVANRTDVNAGASPRNCNSCGALREEVTSPSHYKEGNDHRYCYQPPAASAAGGHHTCRGHVGFLHILIGLLSCTAHAAEPGRIPTFTPCR